MPLEALLKKAVERDDRNVTQLAKAAGVAQSQVFRFVTGERTVSLATAAKLARALGYELKLVKKERP
jgi:plasmid maintenance system antidote protein VapI